MKKIVLLLLITALVIFTGCENRLPKEDSTTSKSSESETTISLEEADKSDNDKSENENERDLDDSELESEAISIAVKLLDQADTCEDIYSGNLKIDTSAETQDLEDDIFYLLDSQFSSVTEIEGYWNNTFMSGGKADKFYTDFMTDNMLYFSINGQLHVKDADTAPMTNGVWSTQNISVISFTDSTLVVSMNTILDGNPNGEQELTIEKVGDKWLLNDSYFLD